MADHERDRRFEGKGSAFYRLWFMEDPEDLLERLGIQPLMAAYVANGRHVPNDTGTRQWPFWSLHLLFEGELEYQVGNSRRRRITAGGAFLHFPGSMNRQFLRKPCRQAWIHFKGRIPDQYRREGLLQPDHYFFDIPRMKRWEEEILLILRSDGRRRDKKRDLATCAFGLLAEIVESARETDKKRRPAAEMVKVVLEDIERGIQGGKSVPARLPLDGLAVPVEVFQKEFRAMTGKTPAKYLAGRKMEAIKGDLSTGDLSIREIAAKHGFYDTFHLSHRFKKLTGMSPVAFRKMMRAEGV